MSANYKNWVPNGMITALTAGTAILGAGTAALMFADMNPMMKKALVGKAKRKLLPAVYCQVQSNRSAHFSRYCLQAVYYR